jgi:hypothetical protein
MSRYIACTVLAVVMVRLTIADEPDLNKIKTQLKKLEFSNDLNTRQMASTTIKAISDRSRRR